MNSSKLTEPVFQGHTTSTPDKTASLPLPKPWNSLASKLRGKRDNIKLLLFSKKFIRADSSSSIDSFAAKKGTLDVNSVKSRLSQTRPKTAELRPRKQLEQKVSRYGKSQQPPAHVLILKAFEELNPSPLRKQQQSPFACLSRDKKGVLPSVEKTIGKFLTLGKLPFKPDELPKLKHCEQLLGCTISPKTRGLTLTLWLVEYFASRSPRQFQRLQSYCLAEKVSLFDVCESSGRLLAEVLCSSSVQAKLSEQRSVEECFLLYIGLVTRWCNLCFEERNSRVLKFKKKVSAAIKVDAQLFIEIGEVYCK